MLLSSSPTWAWTDWEMWGKGAECSQPWQQKKKPQHTKSQIYLKKKKISASTRCFLVFFCLRWSLMALAGSFSSGHKWLLLTAKAPQTGEVCWWREGGNKTEKALHVVSAFFKVLYIITVPYGLYRRIIVSWELNINRKKMPSRVSVQWLRVWQLDVMGLKILLPGRKAGNPFCLAPARRNEASSKEQVCKFTVPCTEEEVSWLTHPSPAAQSMDDALSAAAQHYNCSSAGARVCAELLGRGMVFPSSAQAERRLSFHELPSFTVLSSWLLFALSPASPLAWEWWLRLGCGRDNARSRYVVTNAWARRVAWPFMF